MYIRCRPHLWSIGQSPWLHIQGSRFDSRRYQILREVVRLKRDPLNLVSTIEELLGRNGSGSGLEIREYGRRDPPSWPRGTLSPQKLALTSPTSCSHSIGIVHSRTQATEFLKVGYISCGCCYLSTYVSEAVRDYILCIMLCRLGVIYEDANKIIWEELIVCFPLILHGSHTE
jgi:hypothetical protein